MSYLWVSKRDEILVVFDFYCETRTRFRSVFVAGHFPVIAMVLRFFVGLVILLIEFDFVGRRNSSAKDENAVSVDGERGENENKSKGFFHTLDLSV